MGSEGQKGLLQAFSGLLGSFLGLLGLVEGPRRPEKALSRPEKAWNQSQKEQKKKFLMGSEGQKGLLHAFSNLLGTISGLSRDFSGSVKA